MEAEYTNRELDSHFAAFSDKLDQLIKQTTKTNGRVTRLEKMMLVVGTTLVVVVALKFPELLVVLKVL